MDKLNINNEMRQFDRKNRDFYDELTDDEKKKFSTYLMLKWGANVDSTDPELAGYYVLAVNENVNKHFFDLSRHPKLQWLLATTVSPDMGTPRHTWIAPKKKETGLSAKKKQLAKLYPHYKDDEIDLLAQITDQKEINTLLKQHGDTD